jgi:type II secretory pathway pseudopilin PulG
VHPADGFLPCQSLSPLSLPFGKPVATSSANAATSLAVKMQFGLVQKMMKTGFAATRSSTHRLAVGQVSALSAQRKGQQAGTLVEVIMAIAILAIMSAGIISSINYGLFIMRIARENARATQVMLEKLESIRLYNWSEVTSNNYVPASFTDVYDPQGGPNQQGVTYYGTMSVTNAYFSSTAPSYSTNMRQFVVTLRWVTAGRIDHYRTLSTLVAKDGVQNYVY